MKKIALIITLLFCNTTLFAQNTFEKIIDTLGSGGASCIKETFDGGYIYGGVCSLNGNDAIIVKLDSIGTIEWVKTYSGPSIEAVAYLEQTPDSGYMVNALYDGGANSKSWLLRLDANGDTLWTKTFSAGNGSTEPAMQNSMASVNNAIYGMAGNYTPIPITFLSAYFISATSNGFLLSNKIYSPSIDGTDVRSVCKTYDGGFIMVGVIGIPPTYSDIYVIRTNTYGDTLWTKSYDLSYHEVAYDIKQTNDSGFIITGIVQNLALMQYNLCLIKTDANGDTLWTKNYVDTLTCIGRSVQQTKDGGYIIVGTINNPDPQVYLVKTDMNGDILWTKEFGTIAGDRGYFVRQTKDGGFIISGEGMLTGVGGTYIIKTDSMGNVNSGTGIAELNNPFKFTVFPNPSTGNFTIQVKGLPQKNTELKVFNLLNQCLYSCRLYNNLKEQIDLSHLPNGMYVATILVNNKMVSQKISIYK